MRFGKEKWRATEGAREQCARGVAWTRATVLARQLGKTEGRLSALGLSSVRADWVREGKPAVTDVTIKLAKGAQREVRFGIGAGADRSRWEAHTRGGYTQHGIFDSPLTTLRLDATPGYSWLRTEGGTTGREEASANLTRDDIFGVGRLQGSALAAYEREPREGYTLSGPRFNLGLSLPAFTDDVNVSASWELQLLDFIDADPMVFGSDATATRLAYFEQRAVLDLRDAPLDAREGIFAQITVDEGPYAGGKVPSSSCRATSRLPAVLPRLTLARA